MVNARRSADPARQNLPAGKRRGRRREAALGRRISTRLRSTYAGASPGVTVVLS
jgi:hypothetical protein